MKKDNPEIVFNLDEREFLIRVKIIVDDIYQDFMWISKKPNYRDTQLAIGAAKTVLTKRYFVNHNWSEM